MEDGRWKGQRGQYANVGRRFLGCVEGENGCGYIRWVDAPFSIEVNG